MHPGHPKTHTTSQHYRISRFLLCLPQIHLCTVVLESEYTLTSPSDILMATMQAHSSALGTVCLPYTFPQKTPISSNWASASCTLNRSSGCSEVQYAFRATSRWVEGTEEIGFTPYGITGSRTTGLPTGPYAGSDPSEGGVAGSTARR